MTDAYVDFEQTFGTASSPYANWADAAADIQTALTQVGAGGRVFVRIDGDGVGTTKDTAASSRTLLFTGVHTNPTALYGVKDATVATPPTDSDLVVLGVDVLPVYQATGASSDITLDEANNGDSTHIVVFGIEFDAGNNVASLTSLSTHLTNCRFTMDSFRMEEQCIHKFTNCEWNYIDNAGGFLPVTGHNLTIHGGKFTGSAITPAFDSIVRSITYLVYGLDLAIVTGVLCDFNNNESAWFTFANCKMAAGFTRVSGTPRGVSTYVELIDCTDDSGVGQDESIHSYAREYGIGTILTEAVFVRAGGVQDGVASYSYVMQCFATSSRESISGIETPKFGGIVAGDGSTSKTFTVYISNDSGSDLTDADVWVEFFSPSEAGDALHAFDDSHHRYIDATPSNVADDTVSDWSTGAGGNNAQKFVITATPDFQGPVYAVVTLAQRGTTKVYVDPKVYVTNT